MVRFVGQCSFTPQRGERPLSADLVEKLGMRTRFWLSSGSGVAVWFGQSRVSSP